MGQEDRGMRWVVVANRNNWDRCQVARLEDFERYRRGGELRPGIGGLWFTREQAEGVVYDLNTFGWVDVPRPE